MRKSTILAGLLLLPVSCVWAGEKIEIIKAEYGALEKWTDVTDKVKSKVTEEGLSISADNNLCEDPAPGYGKVLKITVKAGDKQALFRCSERTSIEINAEAVAAKAAKQERLVILSAEYGTESKKANVIEKVKEMVDEGTLKIQASNQFGDPAPGEGKSLTVKYKINGKEKTVSASEYEYVELLP